ncbi:TIGR04028 family ABC transporter substrate-binding protein [Microbacterium sp. zg.Y1090]|uniref:TIGR04028 family ABC transporter substrate-binding protein n=1 Tax=Microbacterium TaxID=33882 RepID=UPI00214B1AA1|nr:MULTISPECIES: TIGR04028 family ABC transporter substrate-binding protein [unclassified Microbacterium]MCR2812391.1 TIGR04028 family ABC transporter substrate-binding protein [Microbacterium sp. zg.Y1084]MCR2817808.1 TIGR04028 family ABC transporter substrate-binding protein [Microbacterium sp. zg.Y1090]WIM28719.1 TIGR04028 family ABC transporter substrate-binding protein [Microbacterium sp. zg-Y1090]
MSSYLPLRPAAATLAALALITLTACAAPAAGPGGSSSGEPVEGGTLVYLEHQAHTTLYPPSAGFYPNGGIVNNVLDRLVWQDPETRELKPWIATDWEVNADATQYTFNLRDDVTFSDGTALDAAVVAKNFDLYGLGDPDRGLTVSEAINNYERSEVIDDDTVVFHFSAPSPGFLQATSTNNSGLLSAETLDFTLEQFAPGNSAEVIGSGPFTITEETIGSTLTLTARDDYDWAPPDRAHQGRAHLEAVKITVTPEDSVRVGALLSGQADYVRYVEAQDEAQVEAAGFTVYAPQTGGVTNHLSLRPRGEILSDIRVRQAIIAGVDRAEVVDTIYTEKYPLATSILARTAPGYVDTDEAFGYDPQRAATLLDEAGWAEGSDGIRQKNGRPLTLVVNEAAPQPRSFEALTLISQQLKKIGVDLKILKADAGSAAEAVRDVDQVQIYHSMVARADLDVIKSQFHSQNRNALLNLDYGDGSIGDPQLEDLLQAVASEADPQARLADSAEAQRYLADEAYVLPLFEEPQVYGASDRVHGVTFESVARPSFYEIWLDD